MGSDVEACVLPQDLSNVWRIWDQFVCVCFTIEDENKVRLAVETQLEEEFEVGSRVFGLGVCVQNQRSQIMLSRFRLETCIRDDIRSKKVEAPGEPYECECGECDCLGPGRSHSDDAHVDLEVVSQGARAQVWVLSMFSS